MQCVDRHTLNYVPLAFFTKGLLKLNEGRFFVVGEPMVHPNYVLDHYQLWICPSDELQILPRKLVSNIVGVASTREGETLTGWTTNYDIHAVLCQPRHAFGTIQNVSQRSDGDPRINLVIDRASDERLPL